MASDWISIGTLNISMSDNPHLSCSDADLRRHYPLQSIPLKGITYTSQMKEVCFPFLTTNYQIYNHFN